MKILLLLIAGVAAAAARPAAADVRPADAGVLEVVNWARLHGCGASAGRLPLETDSALQKAAGRLAAGAALREALAGVGYPAAEFSALHFSGALSDGQIGRALTAGYCTTVTNPKFRQMGVQRHGRELWLVLAAPAALPRVADAASVSRRIVDLVNAARAAGRRCGAKYFAPVAALTLSASLTSAALEHSRDMAKNGEFDHAGHDGSTPAVRVQRAGYGAFRIVGENIAAGAMTPAEVAQGWLASPAHCENIMDGRFTQIGIAFAENPRTAVAVYWTQDFAAPRSSPSPH